MLVAGFVRPLQTTFYYREKIFTAYSTHRTARQGAGMRPQRSAKSTTKLPQALLDELHAEETTGVSSRRRRNPALSRKDARKQNRIDKKSLKSRPHSSVNALSEGLPARSKASPAHHVNQIPKPAKRLRVENFQSPRRSDVPREDVNPAPPEVTTSVVPAKHVTFATAITSTNGPVPPPNHTNPEKAQTQLKKLTRERKAPTPLELLNNRWSNKGPKASRAPLSQVEKEEDDEIGWLEAKLGLCKKGQGNARKRSYSASFADDGLDDLLEDVDRIIPSYNESATSSEEDNVLEDVSDSEMSETSSESEDNEGQDETANKHGTDEEEEWQGTQIDTPSLEDPPTQSDRSRYIPPHLRGKAGAQVEETPNEPDPKLSRQLKGLLNKLSEANIASILSEIEAIYRNNIRNDVTSALTNLIIGTICLHATLLDTFVILHAALVASLHKIIGIEFAAHFVQTLVSSYEQHYASASQSSNTAEAHADTLEGSPEEGKEASNLLVLVSELYSLQVIKCNLVYDIIRGLLGSELNEVDVELLLKLLKTCGPQLRQDDPSALKDIVAIVQAKMTGKDTKAQSSRVRFMLETLTNLKNNKNKSATAHQQNGANVAVEALGRMKKFLNGLGKTRTLRAHEPLNVSLDDLHSAERKGKWWLVGSAWAGDPLADRMAEKGGDGTANDQPQGRTKGEVSVVDSLAKLARKQGMNSEIRRNIFVVLMSSDDYVDACERLGQLDLTEIQQREIIRVLLHCCASESAYNPYYTLVAQHLCTSAHSHKITLQYCFWDFLRDLGETSVGGEEMMKGRLSGGQAFGETKSVPKTKTRNVARAYAWWIAKSAVSLNILKPLDFLSLQPQTASFISTLISQMIVDSQISSPAFDFTTASELDANLLSRDREALEIVIVKGARHPGIVQGLLHFFDRNRNLADAVARAEGVRKMLKWGIGVIKDTLRAGAGVTMSLD